LAVLAGLAAPAANIGQKEIHFSWSAAPGQRFTFQVAATPEFTTLINNIETSTAEVAIPRPEAGIYYARVRSNDDDGFVGAFSPAQKFSVPNAMENRIRRPARITGATSGYQLLVSCAECLPDT